MIERYSRPEFAKIWADASRFQAWLRVELAACRAMEGFGIVPDGSAEQIAGAAEGALSAERILEIEETTRHDVIAFLTHVEELAGEPARWLHLGMTSSDVLDTSLALLCREALDRILDGVGALSAALARRAAEHAETPSIGRSHGIHAEPITAGLVFARWHAELERAQRRIERARDEISVGKLAGRCRHLRQYLAADRRNRARGARFAPRDGRQPGRRPRSPRRGARLPRVSRHRHRADGRRHPPLAAHGGRRG